MAPDVVLLDSSFLVAHHNARDVHHRAAAELMNEIVDGRHGRALLLEYVVLEVATVLSARRSHSTAVRVVTTLLGAREVDFVPCSQIFAGALEVFVRQRTGSLSFVDAALVHVARARRGSRLATFDADFAEIDGISVLPG